MAYNNGFPIGYQMIPQPMVQQPQMMAQPQQMAQPQPQTQNDPMIWVTGLAGANAYLVAPNTTVRLWDSEAPVIYIKSADASGMPSMKILDYTIRDTTKPQAPIVTEEQPKMDFVTHEELAEFREELKNFEEKIQSQLTTKKEVKKNDK